MAPVQVAPNPPGATSRQAHEAERWQDRYGRCRASVDANGHLRLDVYGVQPMPWATLKLDPDGWPLDVIQHDGDPREVGLKPTARRVLAELREDPSRWRSCEQLADALGLNMQWVRVNVGLLHDADLIEVEDGGKPRGGRVRPTVRQI